VGHAAHIDRESRAAAGYHRRQPQETVLYQTVAEHWTAFRERAEQASGLPRFVEWECEEYFAMRAARVGLSSLGLP
jgi:hypothetical protein